MTIQNARILYQSIFCPDPILKGLASKDEGRSYLTTNYYTSQYQVTSGTTSTQIQLAQPNGLLKNILIAFQLASDINSGSSFANSLATLQGLQYTFQLLVNGVPYVLDLGKVEEKSSASLVY